MTFSANIKAPTDAMVAIGYFSEMSTTDLATIVDLLISARVTARTTACLANHMERDALEEFADQFVSGIDERLTEMQAEVLRRVANGELEAAAIANLSARLSAILSPGGEGAR